MMKTNPNPFPVIDTHVHLDDLARVTASEINEVVTDAIRHGVDKFVVPGLFPEQWPQIQRIRKSFPNAVYCGVGIHPWWVETLSTIGGVDLYKPKLKECIEREGCIAVGETGLDRLKNQAYDQQIAFLDMHLSVAAEFNKPIIIHCVRAHNDLQRLLKKYQGQVSGVIHGFSGSAEIALDYWNKGFYLGIGGTITYPRANKTRQAVSKLPLQSLLLETDAPAMPVFGCQGTVNRSEQLFIIAKETAKLKRIDTDEVMRQAGKNADLLFRFSAQEK